MWHAGVPSSRVGGRKSHQLVRRNARRSSAVLVTRWKPGATRGATRCAEVAQWISEGRLLRWECQKADFQRSREGRAAAVFHRHGHPKTSWGSDVQTGGVGGGARSVLCHIPGPEQTPLKAGWARPDRRSGCDRSRPDGGCAPRRHSTLHGAQHAADRCPAALSAPAVPTPSVPAAPTATTVPVVSSAAPTVLAGSGHPTTASSKALPPTTTSTATPAAPATPAPSHSGCGGQPNVDVNGQTWQCSFDEEFNRTTWTPASGSSSRRPTVAITPGSSASKTARTMSRCRAALCISPWNSRPRLSSVPANLRTHTQYTSGMVSTYQHFIQTDGLFEVRAKIRRNHPRPAELLLALPGPADLRRLARVGRDRLCGTLQRVPYAGHPVVHYDNWQRSRGHQ